jgi:hypothetical protein
VKDNPEIADNLHMQPSAKTTQKSEPEKLKAKSDSMSIEDILKLFPDGPKSRLIQLPSSAGNLKTRISFPEERQEPASATTKVKPDIPERPTKVQDSSAANIKDNHDNLDTLEPSSTSRLKARGSIRTFQNDIPALNSTPASRNTINMPAKLPSKSANSVRSDRNIEVVEDDRIFEDEIETNNDCSGSKSDTLESYKLPTENDPNFLTIFASKGIQGYSGDPRDLIVGRIDYVDGNKGFWQNQG